MGPAIGPRHIRLPTFPASTAETAFDTNLPREKTHHRGTETRRRGSRKSEIGNHDYCCMPLNSLFANFIFARTVIREGEELGLLTLCPAPVQLQHYYGGAAYSQLAVVFNSNEVANLSVIPSQAQPGRQLANVPVGSEAAISSNSRHLSSEPPSLRGKSPLPFGTLVFSIRGFYSSTEVMIRTGPSSPDRCSGEFFS